MVTAPTLGINNVSSKEDTSVFAVVGTNKVAKVLFAYGGTGAENADNYMYVLNKTPMSPVTARTTFTTILSFATAR